MAVAVSRETVKDLIKTLKILLSALKRKTAINSRLKPSSKEILKSIKILPLEPKTPLNSREILNQLKAQAPTKSQIQALHRGKRHQKSIFKRMRASKTNHKTMLLLKKSKHSIPAILPRNLMPHLV